MMLFEVETKLRFKRKKERGGERRGGRKGLEIIP